MRKSNKNIRESRRLLEGVYVSTDIDGISLRDVLDIYLNWNGISGYTDDIMEIFENGEAWLSQADDEDLSSLKRHLGIRDITKESVRRTGKKLTESSDEIDRKGFGSLIKYDVFDPKGNYAVLSDGNFRYAFWADNDEEAKKIFAKYGTDSKPEVDSRGKAVVEAIRSKDELEEEGLDFEFTIRNEDGEVLGSSKSMKKAISMAKKIPDAKWVEYEEFTIDEGEPWYSEVVWGEKVDESLRESRQLNEGPGSGYRISGKIGDVKIDDINIDTTEDEKYFYYNISGGINLDLVDVVCRSYYYGGEIQETPAKVTKMIMSAEKSWELPTPTEEDVFEMLMGIKFETTYGGGWSHSTFDGSLEMTYNDYDYSSYTYDLDGLEIEFTDPKAVDAIDKYATGDNVDIEYGVIDETGYEVEFFENQDEAVEFAKENGYPTVEEKKWTWEYAGDGDYNSGVDWDTEIVWEAE